MQIKIINKIFEIFSQINPNPKTELQYKNNYTLLIAIVLSAQSTDKSVNIATKELFELYDSPEKMVSLGESGLKEYIRTIGLFNSKAKNIIALSRKLINEYNSQVPSNRELLEALPGVGRKTVNVFLNCAFNEPTIGVDTHVFRVSNRIGIINATTIIDCERKLQKKIAKKWRYNAHNWLVLHGRYVCKAKLPLCSKCRIVEFCKFKNKNLNSKHISH